MRGQLAQQTMQKQHLQMFSNLGNIIAQLTLHADCFHEAMKEMMDTMVTASDWIGSDLRRNHATAPSRIAH